MRGFSDEELMMMFKEGNTAAFDILFDKYRVPVFNFIYRMLNRERGLAEDLLQEIFMKVAWGKDLYEPRASFSTWLFSIVRNHCLNFLKSRRYVQSKSTVSLDIKDKDDQSNVVNKLVVDKTDHRKKKEFEETLEGLIGNLPDKYREVFLLHAVEGFTHEEISKILRVNPATVRTEYHRAKKMIKGKTGVKQGE